MFSNLLSLILEFPFSHNYSTDSIHLRNQSCQPLIYKEIIIKVASSLSWHLPSSYLIKNLKEKEVEQSHKADTLGWEWQSSGSHRGTLWIQVMFGDWYSLIRFHYYYYTWCVGKVMRSNFFSLAYTAKNRLRWVER